MPRNTSWKSLFALHGPRSPGMKQQQLRVLSLLNICHVIRTVTSSRRPPGIRHETEEEAVKLRQENIDNLLLDNIEHSHWLVVSEFL